jgi:YVTN family beta-propeller protein
MIAGIPRRRVGLLTIAALAALITLRGLSGATSPSTNTASASACTAAITSPIFVPVAGTLDDIRFDDSCQHVYASNKALSRIEVFSLQDLSLETPVDVGSAPRGFDITPDGGTMYVANSGGSNISVIDLAAKTELRKITVPPGSADFRPLSIAIASTGKILFSTTFSGSGFGGRLMELNPANDAITVRSDFYYGGTTTGATFLRASGDRSKIGVAVANISSGPVFAYVAATDSFTPEKDLGAYGYKGFIASDSAGSRFLVGSGTGSTYVLDADLNLTGTIPGPGYGVALKPDGDYGYRAQPAGIDILDLAHFISLGTVPLGDTVASAHPATYPARLAISHDGSLLAVITDHGLSLLPASVTAPTATATPTPRPTVTSTSTPRPIGTPTPIISRPPVYGAWTYMGTASLATDNGALVTVRFVIPLRSANYVVMLTPVQRSCQPMVVQKTKEGFSFSCPGAGGSVDWVVITQTGAR